MIAGTLVGTAAGLGVIHVLTGPDHLSAIATLSASVSARRAFFLGLRWGCGHSLGLVVVGIILIAITVPTDSGEVLVPRSLETFFECLVGVFMLLLGAYGIRHALNKRRAKVEAATPPQASYLGRNDGNGSIKVEDDPELTPVKEVNSGEDPGRVQDASCSVHQTTGRVATERSSQLDDGDESGFGYGTSSSSDIEASGLKEPTMRLGGTHSEELVASARHDEEGEIAERANSETSLGVMDIDTEQERDGQVSQPHCNCLLRMSDRLSAGVAALFLGILHGFAGSGGVLGVVPAVQLHDWKLATLYLGTFCLISTLVMGVFAAFYGTVCAKLTGSADKREFIIEMFSSCLSIVVGIVWLVLSPMGKLEVLG